MAFLDKISQASQSAVQKTKDMTEIAKINSSISDEEKKINSLYFEIGRQYTALHKDDSEQALAGLVNSIKESESRISSLRDQILEIRGVQKCPGCGAEIPAGSAFCSVCGFAVPKPETPAGNVCPGCGAPIKEGAAFCSACGFAVPKQEAPAGNVCPGCGAPVKEGTAFCTNCGTKVG